MPDSFFHFRAPRWQVVLYADRNYARNDQVLISYGQKSNAELLLLYGFVVDRNLFDQVHLATQLPRQPSPKLS